MRGKEREGIVGTKEENAVKRTAKVAKLDAQITAWTTEFDDLVASYLNAGAQPNDSYRQRIDGLRDRCGELRTKFDRFNSQPEGSEPWGAFRASIAEDWKAIEGGLKDLTK